MRIKKLTYKSFDFPLKTFLTNSAKKNLSKKIIILIAIDEDNNPHYGEISPLVSFSKETIEDCKILLDQLIIKDFFIGNITELKSKLKVKVIAPSIRFGLEQIILNLEFLEKPNVYKNKLYSGDIESNGIVGIENLDKTLARINKLVNQNFQTIKLKIGRANFNDDRAILEEISNEFGTKIKLRLDVNGRWSLDEAIKNIRKVLHLNIEYVEQPLKDIDQILLLAEEFGEIIVPDECIETVNDAIQLIDSGLIKFIVLKPTIRLGLFETVNLIEYAKNNKVNVIITSSFETAIGRNTLLFLATLTNHNFEHGLSIELLGESFIRTSIDYSQPIIKFDINKYPQQKILF